MRSSFRVLFAPVALASILLAVVGSASAQEKLKVAFVLYGPTGDYGWSYQHFVGAKAVEKSFQGDIDITIAENVSTGPLGERLIQALAAGENSLIFTTSFNLMEPTLAIAQKFKHVQFEQGTGYKRAENVATYSARFYEGRHIIGLIAGKMTRTNTIGYIASFPIPEVVMGINSAYLAARSVNPNVIFKIIWIDTWYSWKKEGAAAKALIEQGADVLMQHTDSPAAVIAAEENGILAFGQGSDMKEYGPNAHLTAIVNNWGPYYIRRVQAALGRTWKAIDTWGGFGSEMLKMAPYSSRLPADVIVMAREAEAAIAAGKRHPFTGPIRKQDGSVWLRAGEAASDEALLKMNFFVYGIDSALPRAKQ